MQMGTLKIFNAREEKELNFSVSGKNSEVKDWDARGISEGPSTITEGGKYLLFS